MIAVIILNAVILQKINKIVLIAPAQMILAVIVVILADNIVRTAVAQTLQ